MAYPKITVNTGLAVNVFASDTIRIPYPGLPQATGIADAVVTGTSDGQTDDELLDSTKDFLLTDAPLPVVNGDKAFNTTVPANAVVTGVAATVLSFATNPFPIGTQAYVVTRPNHLIDAAGDFVNKGVTVGDVVYNTTASTIATVTAINNASDITLSADLFGEITTYDDNYVIYLAGNGPLGNQRINSAEGCLLYVGSNTTAMTVELSYVDVKVKTVAGNDVTFYNFPVGEYLPIQILQLYATGTTDASDFNCLAIW